MLQKLQGWMTRVNLSLMQLTLTEEKQIAAGCGAVVFLCLLQPTLMLSMFRLLGIATAVVCAYLVYHIWEREEKKDADYE